MWFLEIYLFYRPLSYAHMTAVWSSFFSLPPFWSLTQARRFMSARFSNNSCTTRTCPWKQALCRAVKVQQLHYVHATIHCAGLTYNKYYIYEGMSMEACTVQGWHIINIILWGHVTRNLEICLFNPLFYNVQSNIYHV